jgi:hypothetical protein
MPDQFVCGTSPSNHQHQQPQMPMTKPIRQVWTFRSDSNPDLEYQTLQYVDGTTSCACKGWTRRVAADGSRSCKHCRFVDDPKPILEMLSHPPTSSGPRLASRSRNTVHFFVFIPTTISNGVGQRRCCPTLVPNQRHVCNAGPGNNLEPLERPTGRVRCWFPNRLHISRML